MKIQIIKLATITCLLYSLLFCTANATSYNACESNMINAARNYGVPLSILYAVAMTETGYKNSLQPYALNIDGRSVFYNNKQEALSAISKAKSRGARMIDVGCMQINQRFHGSKFRSLSDMLDPEKNVSYAAKFLKSLYNQEHDWTRAVARYHTGDRNHIEQKRYICRVIKNIVDAGMGNLTLEAKRYCTMRG